MHIIYALKIIKIKICQKLLARKFTLFEQNAGNLCATVPISGKRVFGK
jgi:hypothetical protein